MVVRAAPVLPAMSRMLQPAAFSRSTSRIFLTGSLFLGTASSFELQACNSVKKDACLPWWTKARPARERPLSAGALSAFSRRGVRDGPERCPLSIGTSVRFEPDYALVAEALLFDLVPLTKKLFEHSVARVDQQQVDVPMGPRSRHRLEFLRPASEHKRRDAGLHEVGD